MSIKQDNQVVMAQADEPGAVPFLRTFLQTHPSVEFIVYQFMDLAGIMRCHLTTISRALSIAAKSEAGLGFPANMCEAGGVDNYLHQEMAFRGVDVAVPDWSSIFACYYAPQRAVVNCFVRGEKDGYSRCLRSSLQKLVRDAGMSTTKPTTFLIGFEIEFYIIPSVDSQSPLETPTTLFSPASLRPPTFKLCEDVVRILEKAGIEVWKFHSEGGHGCYEIATAPLPPLQAVDALLYAQEAIRSVASARGYHATMHPKPFEEVDDCGLHMHISMSSPDGTRKPKDVADSFLAGLLQSTPALCGIAMPNYDSYSRAHIGINKQWVSWGQENRLATIREIEEAHWEVRKIDAMSNIYLVLLSMLGVGLSAVDRQEKLTMKPLLTYDMDGNLEQPERTELGVTTLLPSTLKEALECLENDTYVREVVSKHVLETYLTVKKKEEERFAKMTRSERVKSCIKNF